MSIYDIVTRGLLALGLLLVLVSVLFTAKVAGLLGVVCWLTAAAIFIGHQGPHHRHR
jgi:hypothetical protein